MSLVAFTVETNDLLAVLKARFTIAPYSIGLFKSAWVPVVGSTIADVFPCDYGGYNGLRPLTNWGLVTWEPPRSTMVHTPITWTADGTTANSVYGYYVVNSLGQVAWAELRTGGPITIGSAGQVYVVTPMLTLRSEF